MRKNNLEILQQKIGYVFDDKELLVCAMTHKSCKSAYNNERLEFLGDAVVDLIVGEYLFLRFPNFQEGKLSKIRAAFVNEEGLAKFAKAIGLPECIRLSSAEDANGGRQKLSILADAFEALIGAIFLESGLKQAQAILNRLIQEFYGNINFEEMITDFKTALQEVTQARFALIPEYVLLAQEGPDHQKSFEVAVWIGGKEYARGVGKSKKQAQQECAKLAYLQLEKEGE
ncbi:ribonuclease III [Helicobacter enhydrae]|uniref:Ribonuclease 3 n=1 Tax=Helicobacter enhydrae TaxID=222136 RepID=A0A1B1U6D1_9HELI|nr:ribonuclease III [Helicobacter enhydrae]ANV98357.1 ribonuclease III [Helicobacter enhydrae]